MNEINDPTVCEKFTPVSGLPLKHLLAALFPLRKQQTPPWQRARTHETAVHAALQAQHQDRFFTQLSSIADHEYRQQQRQQRAKPLGNKAEPRWGEAVDEALNDDAFWLD